MSRLPRRPALPSPATSRSLPHRALSRSIPHPARRGILVGLGAALLSSCGALPLEVSGDTDDEDDTRSDADDHSSPEDDRTSSEGSGASPDPSAVTLSIPPTVLEDARDIDGLVDPFTQSEELLAPWAAVTITASGLLSELSPEEYTALTGEEPPTLEDSDEETATRVVPEEGTAFLVASWESTDSEWSPTTRTSRTTTLSLAVDGNVETMLERADKDRTEHSGAVLVTVDEDASAEDATIHVEIADGVQQISLLDGTITETIAPRLYEGGLDVEVVESETLDTTVQDGFGKDDLSVQGTVDEAYLTPYIASDVDSGGTLDWAREDEIFLVVPLNWKHDSMMNARDLSEVVLVLPDGEELRAEQDQSTIFGDMGGHIATFTVPADLESATVKITPVYGKVIDKEYRQEEDPVTATLRLR